MDFPAPETPALASVLSAASCNEQVGFWALQQPAGHRGPSPGGLLCGKVPAPGSTLLTQSLVEWQRLPECQDLTRQGVPGGKALPTVLCPAGVRPCPSLLPLLSRSSPENNLGPNTELSFQVTQTWG